MSDESLRRRIEHLEAEVRSLRAFENAPYRAIVEDMTELVVRWKPDGTRTFVNDAYCRLFDAPREKLIGTSFWELISDEDREAVEERIQRLSPEQPVTTGRHRAQGPGGRSIWMEWCDRALYDENWNIAELQSVGRDITERVHCEERARAVERAEAISRSSAGIAHDLANVFTVLGSLVQMAPPSVPKEDLYTANTAIEHGQGLLGQLRRLQYGWDWHWEEIDLNRRIAEDLDLFQQLVGTGLRIRTKLSVDPCVIKGDPVQIDQALLNLVRNAGQAAAGRGRVELATERLATRELADGHRWTGEPPADCCVVRVSDDAGGIPSSVLSRVFEPHVTTKKNGQGLGLATVKAVVQAHGGSVRVESSNGGTIFELAFPVAEVPAVKDS